MYFEPVEEKEYYVLSSAQRRLYLLQLPALASLVPKNPKWDSQPQEVKMSLASFATTKLSVGRCFHFLMYGASARHVVRIRAFLYLIYDPVALFPLNRTSCEHGILIGKEVLYANPHGVYVTRLAQKERTILLVSSGSNADGGYLVFKTAEVGTTLLAFHRPGHRSFPEQSRWNCS